GGCRNSSASRLKGKSATGRRCQRGRARMSLSVLTARARGRRRENGKVRQRALALPLTLAGLFAGCVGIAGLGVSALGRIKRAPALAIRSVQVRGITHLDPG